MCAYNEIGRIEKSYEDLLESRKNRNEKIEILFIDNGSTDGTREWLQTITDPDVKLIFNETNLGKGGSIKKGIQLSEGKYVVIHDPDFEYRAADVWKCYDHAKETGAAFVLGSRILGDEVRYEYLANYLGVKFLSFVINVLYGCRLTDTATAMKLLDGDVIRSLSLRCNGFDLDFELVTRVARSGGRIVEVPAEYYPRTVAEGKKIKAIQDGLASLKVILKDRFVSRSSILR
jgi:glycosyltransferase involved in cell wall biosynthesis